MLVDAAILIRLSLGTYGLADVMMRLCYLDKHQDIKTIFMHELYCTANLYLCLCYDKEISILILMAR